MLVGSSAAADTGQEEQGNYKENAISYLLFSTSAFIFSITAFFAVFAELENY